MPDSGWNPIADRTGRGRSSTAASKEKSRPGSDPLEEPASFEAWVSDLPQTHAESEATHPAAGMGPAHPLTLHVTVSRHAKVARGLLLVATIALPLVLVVNAVRTSAAGHTPTTSSSALHSLLVKSRAPVPWLAGHLGAVSAEGALDVQPATMDGDVVYACWVDAPSGRDEPAPLHVAVSADGASTWRTLSTPLPRATACHLVPDAADARRIALAAQLDAGAAAGCSVSRMFASKDGGMHWSSVAVPGALARACAVSLLSTGGTLVLWSNGVPASTSMPAAAQIWFSFDSGTTWRTAGAGLPGGNIESVAGARADGALLVLMHRFEAGAGTAAQAQTTSELWSCPAGCPRWQRVAVVPGSASTVYTTPSGWLSASGDWGTLYTVDTAPAAGSEQAHAASTTSDNASPAPIYVNTGTQANVWRLLPPPPWSAPESGAPAVPGDRSRILGVGPDGILVVESRNAAVALEPGAITQEQAGVGVLSMWDPRHGQWLTPVLVEPAASTVLAVVWDDQGTDGALRLTIWLGTRSGDVWPMVITGSDWSAAQSAPRCERCR